jgi:hypothetical protein
MTSCPKGVTFWHNKQVIELVGGDVGPPKAISSWCKWSSSIKHAKSSSNCHHHKYPNLPSMMSYPRSAVHGLQRQVVGARKVGASFNLWARTQVPQGKATSLIQMSKKQGRIVQLMGFKHQVKVQVTLCLHEITIHLSRPCQDKKIRPPRAHKSQASCQVSHK